LKRRCKRITKADGREDGKWDNERRITFSHIPSLWHGVFVEKRRAYGLEIGWFIHTR